MKHWHLLLLLFFFNQGVSQIKSINYQISFNPETSLFDCYLIIKEGQATNFRHRTQFNAQFSILVPGGSKVEMVKSYMPLQNNYNNNGITPQDWVISNIIKKPDADPFYDYVSIVPRLSPVSAYNDLKEGDKVKLFSLKISPISDCGESVKLFDKSSDLNSGDRGMFGGDFSNGFTIGGIEQKYAGNAPQIVPALNAVQQISKEDKSGLKLSAVMNSGFNSSSNLRFEWQGPSGFTSNSKDVYFPKLTSKHYGTYQLTVMDERGCKDLHTIEIKAPEKGGQNVDMVATHTSLNADVLKTREKQAQPVSEEIILENTTNVKLYPNPAQNYFNISVKTQSGLNLTADITDANGRMIRKNFINTTSTAADYEVSVPLQDIQPGLYNVVIKAGDVETIHKLIVVK